MWPGNLAPNDANLGSTNFLLSSVDVGNLLAQVEAAVTKNKKDQYTNLN